MAEHQGKIDGLMLGVGAGFDYYAENIKRAPDVDAEEQSGMAVSVDAGSEEIV